MTELSCFSIFSLLLLLSSINFVRVEEAGILTEESLANKINAFGNNLLTGLLKDTALEDNVLVSPVNAYSALALLHLGAGDRTRDELAAVMKLSDNKNSTKVHQQLKAILSKLLSKPDGVKVHNTVLAANGIFLHKNFPFKDSYIQLTKKYYDSSPKNVDFSGNPQESTNVINNWISETTKGHIAKFYDGPTSDETVAVLISALYFKATWEYSFLPEKTKIENFNTGMKIIQTPIMTFQRALYYEKDHSLHYDCVTLPYAGQEYEMAIYLQHSGHGSLAQLVRKLALKNFAATNGSQTLVNLKLPKMKLSWKKSVKNALKLEAIFAQPDLGEMTTSTRPLEITNAIHATDLEVDEKGTVATATTVVEVEEKAARVLVDEIEPINFHVNRPFVLTIRHNPTQTILFAGVIRKPIQSAAGLEGRPTRRSRSRNFLVNHLPNFAPSPNLPKMKIGKMKKRKF